MNTPDVATLSEYIDMALRSIKAGRADVLDLVLPNGRHVIVRREPEPEPKPRGKGRPR